MMLSKLRESDAILFDFLISFLALSWHSLGTLLSQKSDNFANGLPIADCLLIILIMLIMLIMA